jgi:class 3 adenylate cyclase
LPHLSLWRKPKVAFAVKGLPAEIAGYSRLIGIDEEGTLTRLKHPRRTLIDPKLLEHHGCIVKTMGDGLLVQCQRCRCVVQPVFSGA